MARFDGELTPAGEASLDMVELLSALASTASAEKRQRQEAIACFLSASEGWKDARGALKGAFAALPGASWLTDDKE